VTEEPKPLDLEEIARNIFDIFDDEEFDLTVSNIKSSVKKHIKSAVQGLKQDIERGKRITADEGKRYTYDYCIHLIKKWFPIGEGERK